MSDDGASDFLSDAHQYYLKYKVREASARKRTPAVLAAVVAILICGPIFVGFLFVIVPEPERVVDDLEIDGVRYQLTCRASIDGPIHIVLYRCETQSTDQCQVLERGGTLGIACEDLSLGVQYGIVYAGSESGGVLFTYDPDEAN